MPTWEMTGSVTQSPSILNMTSPRNGSGMKLPEKGIQHPAEVKELAQDPRDHQSFLRRLHLPMEGQAWSLKLDQRDWPIGGP